MDVHIRHAGSRHGRVDVRRCASLSIGLYLTLLLSQVAGADSPSGHISAVRHEALPADMTILVRSGNAIPAGRRAADRVGGGLLERGFEASPLAGVLRLDIHLATNLDIDLWESSHWRFAPEGLRYRSHVDERNIIDPKFGSWSTRISPKALMHWEFLQLLLSYIWVNPSDWKPYVVSRGSPVRRYANSRI